MVLNIIENKGTFNSNKFNNVKTPFCALSSNKNTLQLNTESKIV